MRRRMWIALLSAGLLPGCYWEPPTAAIMVATTPPGASCLISQLGQKLGVAEPTPAITVATLAGAEITVVCRRPGFAETAVAIPPPAPAVSLPGVYPNRRPRIDYNTRVDVTMLPAPP
jgi:hypothetical protein